MSGEDVIEPDAIFSRDGIQVWPEKKDWRDDSAWPGSHFGLFQIHEPSPTTNPWSGTEEHLIHSDPGSSWGWYRDDAGGTSFRRRDKR